MSFDWKILLVVILLVGGFVLLDSSTTIEEENPTVIVSKLPIEESGLDEMLFDNKAEEKIPSPEPEETMPSLDEFEQAVDKASEPLEEIIEVIPTEPEKEKIPQSKLYDITIERLVNLFCAAPGNSVVLVSGFLISAEGHILTNAHTSDLLEEKVCQVRQGSPAKVFAIAEEVFKPIAYQNANIDDLETRARNDFAIWKIVSSSGIKPLPEKFPFFTVSANEKAPTGETLVALSYPSELLGYQTLLKNLNILFTETTVVDQDADLILSSGTLSSQGGSSGGVILSQFTARPVGLIFAVEKREEISERILYSLSTGAIESVIKKETGQSLDSFLGNN